MFREIRFYDDYTSAVAAPWWMFALLALNFFLLGTLIIIFPELLAYLVAGFFFDGALLVLIAWKFWRFKKLYGRLREASGCLNPQPISQKTNHAHHHENLIRSH